ncbi:MAG: MIP/aquaporin family protein [Pseudomonadota bacterium]
MTRKLIAEALGTALLLISVVASGIMAETLTSDIGLALLANALATGAMLYAIITCLGPISGAHFNPAVTLAFFIRRDIALPLALGYVGVQIVGGVLGVIIAHAMFDQSLLQSSSTARSGSGLWVSEAVATFGLLFVIFGGLRARPGAVPALVAIYIVGAYWFTSSTSFANPAVTIARSFTDTFSGILPAHAPAYIAIQLATAALVTPLLARLLSDEDQTQEQ